MEKSELLSVKEASEILGISPATVKNWIKLGKLSGRRKGASFLLSKEDVLKKSKELSASSALRSRRNKSRLTSNFIPKSYISSSSPNYKTIKELVLCNDLEKSNLCDVLYIYSKSLLKEAGVSDRISNTLLKELCGKNSSSKKEDFLKEYPLSLIPGEDTLGMLYLSLRSMQDKKSTGAYYTPFFVVDELIGSVLSYNPEIKNGERSILDPACGTGNFLLRLPDSIPLSKLHGYDIDCVAVALARINLAIRYRITTPNELDLIMSNFRAIDFLFSKNISAKTFDVVIGNPPWGYSFDAKKTGLIKKEFESEVGKGKPESFSLFVEKGLKYGKSLCFVLPETILSSDYHHGIRKYIMDNYAITALSYLGEAFDNVQCPCITMSISRSKDSSVIKTSFYKKQSLGEKSLSLIRSFSVPKSRINSDNFNILADDAEYAILEKMDNTPHFTLKDKCDFALGIVTGSNRSILSEEYSMGLEPIIKGKDISKFSITVGNSYTKFSKELYQQVAPEKYYRAKEKLFYRFIADEPVVALDNEGLLSLNSANIMIPSVEGYSNYYIMAILNSRAMSFYYKHTCKNLKVLRSALEALPIPCCDLSTQKDISDMSLEITNWHKMHDKNKDEKSLIYTIKRLDKCIANLYNLNANEIKIISNL